MAITQPTPLPAPAGPVERLAAAAAELPARDLDGLAEQQLDADLATLERQRERLEPPTADEAPCWIDSPQQLDHL